MGRGRAHERCLGLVDHAFPAPRERRVHQPALCMHTVQWTVDPATRACYDQRACPRIAVVLLARQRCDKNDHTGGVPCAPTGSRFPATPPILLCVHVNQACHFMMRVTATSLSTELSNSEPTPSTLNPCTLSLGCVAI